MNNSTQSHKASLFPRREWLTTTDHRPISSFANLIKLLHNPLLQFYSQQLHWNFLHLLDHRLNCTGHSPIYKTEKIAHRHFFCLLYPTVTANGSVILWRIRRIWIWEFQMTMSGGVVDNNKGTASGYKALRMSLSFPMWIWGGLCVVLELCWLPLALSCPMFWQKTNV